MDEEANPSDFAHSEQSKEDTVSQNGSIDHLMALIQDEHPPDSSWSKEELKGALAMLDHEYMLKINHHYYTQVDIAELLAEEESEGEDVESGEDECSSTESEGIEEFANASGSEMNERVSEASGEHEQVNLGSELGSIMPSSTEMEGAGLTLVDVLGHNFLKTIPPSVMCAMHKELEAYTRRAMSLLELVLHEKYEMNRANLLKRKFVVISEGDVRVALSLMPTLNKLV